MVVLTSSKTVTTLKVSLLKGNALTKTSREKKARTWKRLKTRHRNMFG